VDLGCFSRTARVRGEKDASWIAVIRPMYMSGCDRDADSVPHTHWPSAHYDYIYMSDIFMHGVHFTMSSIEGWIARDEVGDIII
jgi:hypothetical protein